MAVIEGGRNANNALDAYRGLNEIIVPGHGTAYITQVMRQSLSQTSTTTCLLDNAYANPDFYAGPNGVAGSLGEYDAFIGRESLSGTALKHPLNRHTPARVANQFRYMSESAIQKYLQGTTFFNRVWSEEQIIQALNYGYQEALANGISTGEYSFKYLGDNITVYLENGTFHSGYGDYRYTYEEIMQLLDK